MAVTGFRFMMLNCLFAERAIQLNLINWLIDSIFHQFW